jgi:hypothetical protein
MIASFKARIFTSGSSFTSTSSVTGISTGCAKKDELIVRVEGANGLGLAAVGHLQAQIVRIHHHGHHRHVEI